MAHPNQVLNVGYAGHPLNLRCPRTNMELIYCPKSKAWLKLGCAKVKKPSARTHIWQREDAKKYLEQITYAVLSQAVKIIIDRSRTN